ncbi:Probable polyketide synthase [Mycobacteroides abscessus subsp. bolletii]|uniref:thioesterase II family protein n=1 Tax=Mycobacteroides abscessus TaxID=36809 RepID=UPI0009A73FC5|nr:Probable polyketide synthase [Mycobacteroides abscessus subsp. bolletii]
MKNTALICFPYAGAGSAVFHSWQSSAAEGLRVCPIVLPGRERRISESPLRSVNAAVDDSWGSILEVTKWADRIEVFGHSLGAVLAYETVCRLALHTPDRSVRLLVSGAPAPSRPRDERATGLPDDQFINRVVEFAGVAHAAFDDNELRSLLLPMIRADVEMHENYQAEIRDPLPFPIVSFRGNRDTLVSKEDAVAWQEYTSIKFEYVEVGGDHMYLISNSKQILQTANIACRPRILPRIQR